MIKQLMWKDFRNQTPVLILGVVLLIGPYLAFLMMSGGSDGSQDSFGISFAWYISLSLILSQITVAVIGGSIVGGEKQDRGLEFLLTLPPARSRIILSKILYCLLVAATIWGLFLFANEIVVRVTAPELVGQTRQIGWATAVVGTALFGVALLMSVLVNGVVIPVTISLTISLALVIGLSRYAAYQEWSPEESNQYFRLILYSLYVSIGLTSTLLACVIFTRRKTP